LVLGSVGALRAETSTLGLEPIWTLNLPLLIQNDWALLLGVLLGILNSYKKFDLISKLANRCGQISLFFLNRIFVPALPLFIFGFILKLSYDGLIFEIVKGNLVSVLSIVLVVMSYLVLLYGVAAKGSWPQFSFYLKNMFPPALTAFSTMSSAATLPLSIQAAEKNADHPDAARAIIPATVNIHLVGDSISIPMMAIMILHSFGMEFPAFTSYLIFAFYFVLSKFAVAGVPGGGILVMVPILEKYLGFTAEMSALITAFYILLDPLITTANVFGNNIFCVLFSKGMSLLSPSLIRQKFNSTRQGISETNPIK
jgi:Na+/H+-dicarboxylate symporter